MNGQAPDTLVFGPELLWVREQKGLYPIGHAAVDDDGRVVLIAPDPHTRRRYTVETVLPTGVSEEGPRPSLERVHRFDAAPGLRLMAATTDDEMYLLRPEGRTRLQAGKPQHFPLLSLLPDGERLAAVGVDTRTAQTALYLADGDGSLLWSRSLPSPALALALSRDGLTVAVALENGEVLWLGEAQQVLRQEVSEDPISALGLADQGQVLIAGRADGGLRVVCGDGEVCWSGALGRPVTHLAADAVAANVAVAWSESDEHGLAWFEGSGLCLWEQRTSHPPTGIALSANGRFLAVSYPGAVSLFELSGDPRTLLLRDLAAARAHLQSCELEQAGERLSRWGGSASTDVVLAGLAEAINSARLVRLTEAAHRALWDGEVSEAVSQWSRAVSLAPFDRELFEEGIRLRESGVTRLAARAREAEAEGDREGATAAWRAALMLDAGLAEPREAIDRLAGPRAAALIAEGDRLAAAGETDAALTAWREAAFAHPAAEVADRIRGGEITRALARGRAYLEAGRIPEAEFQFRRVLALDPDHREARRELARAGEGPSEELTRRFQLLE